MREKTERILSIVINRMCLAVGVFAILPVMVGWLYFSYHLFKMFEAEGIVLESYVWSVLSIGFMCFALVMMFLFTSIMEDVDKELKKMYKDIKARCKLK